MTDLGAAAKLRAAFELSPTILAVTGLDDGLVIEVNDAFLRITGYTREEVLGRPIPELGLWVDPGQREAGLATLRAGQPVRNLEARFRTKGGDEIVAIANADIILLDDRPCVLTALMDITDRVRAQAALRESEQRFAQAFNANPLPMSITSLGDGRHLGVNDAAVRHSGYSREELLGRTKPQLGFWVDPSERDRLIKQLHTEGRVRDFEAVFRGRTGEERFLLVNSEVITYGGEPAVLSVSLDITERKQFERQQEARRQEAETLARAKDEFLAMLGHELRNPLGTITNALGVLNLLVPAEEARRVTDIIARQTAHLTRLVDDLLDVARVTSGKIELRLEPLDLRALAARCLDTFAQAGRTVQHQVTLDGPSVRVHGDPVRLEQILSNLVDNALKYTPPGGAVRVSTERCGHEAVVCVADTGEGIRPEILPRVFDLFVQQPQALDRARGGLGLGLTLVKRLVELHGGTVSAVSPGLGRGSEFTVRLPAAPVADADMFGGGVSPGGGLRSPRRRVLIIEDNADARESLHLLLELAGHEVVSAETGRDALLQLDAFRPDVALVDVGLPGLDGYTVARMIRERPAGGGVVLIAVTGYGQAEDKQRAREAGFDHHVTKPVDPDALERLIATP